MATMQFKAYAQAIDKCASLARDELKAAVARLDTSKKKAARDALLVLAPAMVQKWGELAAMAAAEYYEAVREESLGEPYTAFLADDEPLENIEESVRYACGHLFSKEPDDGE